MDSKAEDYWHKVEEAEVKAGSSRDLKARIMYEDIAAHYRYLAERQDRMDNYAEWSKK